MNYRTVFHKFVAKAGIQQIRSVPRYYTPTYELGMQHGRVITVSDMLKAIEYATRFIMIHFDIDQEKYKEALYFLRICELRFQNKSTRALKKKAIHFANEVLHEIADSYATSNAAKKENEEIHFALDLLIEMMPEIPEY